MTGLFLKLLNQSIAAGWLILAVLALRLALKRAPKRFAVLLWGLVGARALWPFSLPSAWSVLPSAQTVSPGIMMDPAPRITSGVAAVDSAVNPVIAGAFTPAPGDSANPLQIWLPLLAAAWALGAAAMAVYTAVSYALLCRRMRRAVCLRENVFESGAAPTPFVLGVLRPRIYLPIGMTGSARDAVLAHERAHIRRGDHWWKLLGFAVLTLHWMNPLMWAAYVLLCRDIELACDEDVIREMDGAHRADYSQALLRCSTQTGGTALRVCPLTFSEVGVKARIRAVLRYRRPAGWLVAAGAAACVLAAACFLTDPAETALPEEPGKGSAHGSDVPLIASSASGEEVSGLRVGSRYISRECLYMTPISSQSTQGGCGLLYTVERDALVVSQAAQEDSASLWGEAEQKRFPASHWEWQAFPYTNEEWAALFREGNEEMEALPERYSYILYQPLDDEHFLLAADGTLLLAELHPSSGENKAVWSIYTLEYQTPDSPQPARGSAP